MSKLPFQPPLGGLGVRRIVDHAKGAFTASWFEGQGVTHEQWTKLDDCFEVYESQQRASSKTDAAIMSRLKESSSPRDLQRLNRLDSPHANAWLSARPSAMDGTDTILPPPIFRTAVARLLGQPVFSEPVPCPLCKQIMRSCAMLQEVRRQNHEAQSPEEPGVQAR